MLFEVDAHNRKRKDQNGTNTLRNFSISTEERNPQYIKTNKEMQYEFKMI